MGMITVTARSEKMTIAAPLCLGRRVELIGRFIIVA
jgi:hypothetical protein